MEDMSSCQENLSASYYIWNTYHENIEQMLDVIFKKLYYVSGCMIGINW